MIKLDWEGWALLLLTPALAVVAWWRWRLVRAVRAAAAILPRELVGAELLYSEKRFAITTPARLSARLDRAYRLASGWVVLLELKTRRTNRVYLSDIVQLSAQRMVVEHKTGRPVASHGYVVTQLPGRAGVAHRVELTPADTVAGLIRRREAILAGRLVPRPAASVEVCRACAYGSVCPDRRDR